MMVIDGECVYLPYDVYGAILIKSMYNVIP